MFYNNIKLQFANNTFKQIKQLFLSKNAVEDSYTQQYLDTEDLKLSQNHIFISLDQAQHFLTIEIPQNHFYKQLENFQENENIADFLLENKLILSHKKNHKLLSSSLKDSQAPLISFIKINQKIFKYIYIEDNLEIEVSLVNSKSKIHNKNREINQLEFSHKKGEYQDFIQYVQSWLENYPIYFCQLSAIQQFTVENYPDHCYPIQFQKAIKLDQKYTAHHAMQLMLQNTLQHLTTSLSALTTNQFTPDHIHQTRVAIRRMRSALQSFKDWSQIIDPNWKIKLADLFKHLGTTRDLDVIRDQLIPQIELAGSLPIQLPQPQDSNHSIHLIMQDKATTLLLLEILAFSYQVDDSHIDSSKNIKKLATKQIEHLHNLVCKNAAIFNQLEVEKRHEIRKKIKRLRYSLEFTAALFDPKEVSSYIKNLKPAQETLGHYNDLCVAESLFKTNVEQDSTLWFALGWIASEQQHTVNQAQKDLENLAKHKFNP